MQLFKNILFYAIACVFLYIVSLVRQDIEAKGLSEDILLDRNEWRKLIHVPDPA